MSTTASHLQSADQSVAAEPEVGMLNVDELAARLGVTHRFVRRLVEERRVPFHKIGRLVRFDPIEVEQWIHQQRVAPHSTATPVRASPRRH